MTSSLSIPYSAPQIPLQYYSSYLQRGKKDTFLLYEFPHYQKTVSIKVKIDPCLE